MCIHKCHARVCTPEYYVYTNMYTNVYTFMCTYVCIRMYVYTNMYTNVYIHRRMCT